MSKVNSMAITTWEANSDSKKNSAFSAVQDHMHDIFTRLKKLYLPLKKFDKVIDPEKTC